MAPSQDITTVTSAIQQLQPRVNDQRAQNLAKILVDAGTEVDIEPFLLASIVMRESSFQPALENRQMFGQYNNLHEIGLMQNHGASLRVRPDNCTSDLEGARCQIFTGARWLAFSREYCGGSKWVWVSAYGRRACPTEREAREEGRVRRVRNLYVSIGGESWEE